MVKTENKTIKCLVWDLDGTLWDGILLENENVHLKNGVLQVLQTLDKRGILHSIASRNEYHTAMKKLKELGLDQYFIYPEINWNSKADSVKNIAKSINIGFDTIAFIDDQIYERDEVKYSLPEVLCLDAGDMNKLPDMQVFRPRFMTKDSGIRRLMYQSEIKRNREEKEFQGPKEDFLQSLNMELTIFDAKEEDLQRAEELTVRTNQLNATGYTYSYNELKTFLNSEKHRLLMARLSDKYGTYGHIGSSLIEKNDAVWTIKLLLMSCRVMSRGIGSVLLNYIMKTAKKNQAELRAEFVPTDRNRLMSITYRLAGFTDLYEQNGIFVLKNDLKGDIQLPDYLTVKII